MKTQELIRKVDALFTGRRDVYGDGYPDPTKPDKYRYNRVEEPLTHELLLQHLKGRACVGVYPICADNSVAWFAIDFDSEKDLEPEEAFVQALDAAQVQQERLTAAGLVTYLERSRSGRGVHLWGFLDQPVPAAIVRRAIKPHLIEHVTLDRLYPVQDELTTSKPFGNLIALPFWGRGVPEGRSQFLDAAGEPIPPRTFLESVERNAGAVLHHLASKAPKERSFQPAEVGAPNADPGIPGALKVISPYGCQFMRHCWTERRKLPEPMWYAALQVATHFRHGRNFAHLISRDYPQYDEGLVDAKYDQALANDKIGCAWIHDNYPALACANCPRGGGQRLAPHHLSKRTILELASSGAGGLAHVGSFKADMERVARYNSGELSSGVVWPIPGLDEVMRLRPSEMIVVGAMQSMGKTWLFLDSVRALAEQGVYVGAFSAETGEESFRRRLLANMAQVDSAKLKGEHFERLTRDEERRLAEAAERLPKLPIYTDYTSLQPDDVLREWEDAVLRSRIPLDAPAVLFFDYLQFTIKRGAESEYEHLSRACGEFKYLIKILEKTLVMYSQLQREREGAEKPAITWFKGTGRIESDMDGGIIISGERIEGERAPRAMDVVKQREGRSNVRVEFVLDQTCGRWERPVSQAAMEERPNLLGGFDAAA